MNRGAVGLPGAVLFVAGFAAVQLAFHGATLGQGIGCVAAVGVGCILLSAAIRADADNLGPLSTSNAVARSTIYLVALALIVVPFSALAALAF
jgi:hypothetical protein